jgi:hypothetical protein
MRRLTIFLILVLCCVCGTVPAQVSDPLATLKLFSDISKIDIKRLLDGEIFTQLVRT